MFKKRVDTKCYTFDVSYIVLIFERQTNATYCFSCSNLYKKFYKPIKERRINIGA